MTLPLPAGPRAQAALVGASRLAGAAALSLAPAQPGCPSCSSSALPLTWGGGGSPDMRLPPSPVPSRPLPLPLVASSVVTAQEFGGSRALGFSPPEQNLAGAGPDRLSLGRKGPPKPKSSGVGGRVGQALLGQGGGGARVFFLRVTINSESIPHPNPPVYRDINRAKDIRTKFANDIVLTQMLFI